MAAVSFSLCGAISAHAETYFDNYGLVPGSPTVDLGVQPLGYPSGLISAVMRHDRILAKALATQLRPLKTHPFKQGTDMIALLQDHRLEAGFLGDIPTIIAASTGSVWIAGLVKQASTAIIAKDSTELLRLKGKRIAYVANSSAHQTLLKGLALAGLSEAQVTLVPLGVDEMPEALERGTIDAFAAWEPATSIALGKSNSNHVVFRGFSTNYFVIERDFAKQSPEAARHVVAGFLRAIHWMRRSHLHTEKAARWVMEDAQAFTGKPVTLTVAQIAAIAHREILDIPSAPAILRSPGNPPLKGGFDFLATLGKLPPKGTWQEVETAFTYDGLAKVMAVPRYFQIANFDYVDTVD
jgi:sulfonate transport system substrate-binding protein